MSSKHGIIGLEKCWYLKRLSLVEWKQASNFNLKNLSITLRALRSEECSPHKRVFSSLQNQIFFNLLVQPIRILIVINNPVIFRIIYQWEYFLIPTNYDYDLLKLLVAFHLDRYCSFFICLIFWILFTFNESKYSVKIRQRLFSWIRIKPSYCQNSWRKWHLIIRKYILLSRSSNFEFLFFL